MFTTDEIQLISEGLDALRGHAALEEFSATLMGAMIARNKEEALSEAQKGKDRLHKIKVEQVALEERIILLKAKLIQLRDRAEVNELTVQKEG